MFADLGEILYSRSQGKWQNADIRQKLEKAYLWESGRKQMSWKAREANLCENWEKAYLRASEGNQISGKARDSRFKET